LGLAQARALAQIGVVHVYMAAALGVSADAGQDIGEVPAVFGGEIQAPIHQGQPLLKAAHHHAGIGAKIVQRGPQVESVTVKDIHATWQPTVRDPATNVHLIAFGGDRNFVVK